MVFMEAIRISVMVSIVCFFQQGNDTHAVLHIIADTELKLDFANLKIAISIKKKKSQLDIFPKSHSPTGYQ